MSLKKRCLELLKNLSEFKKPYFSERFFNSDNLPAEYTSKTNFHSPSNSKLALVLAFASFLPISGNSANAQSQEILFENRNLGTVQEIEKINSQLNSQIDTRKTYSIFQNIPKESSLDSFVRNTGMLSKYEKVELLGRLGSLAGYRLYDKNDSIKDANEEFVFQGIANSIRSGKDVEVGVCRQIHNFITQTARKWELPAVSFSNYYQQGGHISSAVKIDNKWAIINYGEIFQSKDSNLFSALDNFQKMDGSSVFQQEFYLGNKLSFVRITPDGETFYNFNIANPTDSALHKYLIKNESILDKTSLLKISSLEKSVTVKNEMYFLKFGTIEGHDSALRISPMLKIGARGEERNGSTDSIFEADLTLAKFAQDKLVDNALIMNFLTENRFYLSRTEFGQLDLLLGFDSTTKLNNRSKPPDPNFSRLEVGLRLGNENDKDEFAYLISSGKLMIVDLLNSEGMSLMNEHNIGFKKKLSKNSGLIINPNIDIRPEETKYSLSAELRKMLGNYQIDLSSDVFFTRTHFKDINPEKKGASALFQISKEGKGIEMKYSEENLYWPEKDERESFEIGFFRKF